MTNIDTIWHANDQNVLSGGASNIGSASQTFGGVGYNLALACGRADTTFPPILLTAVGVDHFAEQIRYSCFHDSFEKGIKISLFPGTY